MFTIKDVAKLAGVSLATVSRVINNQDGISVKTREKVLKVIKKVGYEKNRRASNLRKKFNNVILVVIPDFGRQFFSNVIEGIDEEAIKQKYNVMLGITKGESQREKDYIKLIKQRGVDGAIFASLHFDIHKTLALSYEFPIVFTCQCSGEANNFPEVSIDNVKAAHDAVNYLISLGHRRIAHITGPKNNIVTSDRILGYSSALNSVGISLNDKLIYEGNWKFDSGFNATNQMLDLKPLPTAIFASSDEMALGAISAIRSRGLNVPESISVMGFDDIEMAKMFDIPLTTVSQPMHKIGVIAMKILLDMIQNPEKTKHKKIRLPYVIKKRQSTKALK